MKITGQTCEVEPAIKSFTDMKLCPKNCGNFLQNGHFLGREAGVVYYCSECDDYFFDRESPEISVASP